MSLVDANSINLVTYGSFRIRCRQYSNELVAKYKDINVPTLIIWGRQDKIISPEAGTLLDQDIPNSILKWIDQCGHVPQEEKPEGTVPLVLDFLRGL